MLRFRKFNEATIPPKELQGEAAKKAMLNYITSSFQRFLNLDTNDNKGLLLLVAALNVLNTGDSSAQTISTARRLTQMAFKRSMKK